MEGEVGQVEGRLDAIAAPERWDTAAFTDLVQRHDDDLVRVAFVITRDREAARDAAQTTWERVWHRRPVLRDPGRLRSYLVATCANDARQLVRRRLRGRLLELRSASAVPGSPNTDSQADLHAALGRLQPEERELLALRFVAELPSDEIATHLGISAEGARTRLHRLLRRLREDLDHDD